MEKELILSSHAVGESNFHIQLTPAYRRNIFVNENVAELTLAYILEKFVADLRFVSEIDFVKQIKGYSSRMMRKNFWHLFKKKLWGKKFWSEGHFYRSVGAVNKETMKHYIEECQDKHWEKINKPKIVRDFQKNLF